jgi:hypothetical protein
MLNQQHIFHLHAHTLPLVYHKGYRSERKGYHVMTQDYLKSVLQCAQMEQKHKHKK